MEFKVRNAFQVGTQLLCQMTALSHTFKHSKEFQCLYSAVSSQLFIYFSRPKRFSQCQSANNISPKPGTSFWKQVRKNIITCHKAKQGNHLSIPDPSCSLWLNSSSFYSALIFPGKELLLAWLFDFCFVSWLSSSFFLSFFLSPPPSDLLNHSDENVFDIFYKEWQEIEAHRHPNRPSGKTEAWGQRISRCFLILYPSRLETFN